MICSVEGCDRSNRITLGLCNTHYERYRRTGSAGEAHIAVKVKGAACSVEGCTRKARCKGYCNAHYKRVRTTGSVGTTRVQNRGGVERCTQPGCSKAHSAKGYCQTHYWRYRVYGPEALDRVEACAICGEVSTGKMGLHVDHDHSCCDFSPKSGRPLCGGCIRGLLCKNCNNGLGMFLDSPELLELAAAYLRKWGR